MELLEHKFSGTNELFVIEHDLMVKIRREIKKLIKRERWADFVETFKNFNVL